MLRFCIFAAQFNVFCCGDSLLATMSSKLSERCATPAASSALLAGQAIAGLVCARAPKLTGAASTSSQPSTADSGAHKARALKLTAPGGATGLDDATLERQTLVAFWEGGAVPAVELDAEPLVPAKPLVPK